MPSPPNSPYVRYSPHNDETCAASTQLNPVSAHPAAISHRGPNRSTSHPWNGLKNVCSTINMLNVTWIEAAETFNDVPNGRVNNAHTYCGLEMAIMQISPNSNCTQRVEVAGTASGSTTVVLMDTPDASNVRSYMQSPGQALPCPGPQPTLASPKPRKAPR